MRADAVELGDSIAPIIIPIRRHNTLMVLEQTLDSVVVMQTCVLFLHLCRILAECFQKFTRPSAHKDKCNAFVRRARP